jgi:hypothetical protein
VAHADSAGACSKALQNLSTAEVSSGRLAPRRRSKRGLWSGSAVPTWASGVSDVRPRSRTLVTGCAFSWGGGCAGCRLV